jgi:hypothetical protein
MKLSTKESRLNTQMKALKISKEISLPIDAVTQTLAAIGRKGAGKTYLATMIAEQMLDAKAQVVVIDPVGNWWGLRVDSDGKSKGKEIFVIGGEHGDVPLLPDSGARVARLIVEKNISAVLDVSSFRIGEHKRFAADFAEEFFHLKKTNKGPVHVFIEEAQKIIPQRVGPDEARMVGAFEQIVRLGRNYGIGATLITQRPQSVNKEVLSQVECLCVLQVTGPHERKALEEWVYEAGADRKLVGELPGLAQGEGYVWSPAWLRIYERVHFSKKTTFDASATPEVGKATKAASLSAVDIDALREDMAEVIKEAEKDDPKALRKRIHELEREVKTRPEVAAEIKTIEVPVLKDGQIAQMEKIAEKMYAEAERHGSAMALLWGNFDEIGKSMAQAMEAIAAHQKLPAPKPVIVRPDAFKKMNLSVDVKVENTGLSGPEQRIVNSIAWLQGIGVDEPNKTAVAFLAGYTYGSGGFNNPCGSLRSKGYIEYRPGNRIVLTETGVGVAQPPDAPLTQDELHAKVLTILPGPEQRILKPLLEGKTLSNEELAEASGYKLGSGGFNNPKGRLRSLGLIEYPQPNYARASDILFI